MNLPLPGSKRFPVTKFGRRIPFLLPGDLVQKKNQPHIQSEIRPNVRLIFLDRNVDGKAKNAPSPLRSTRTFKVPVPRRPWYNSL